MTLKPSSPGVPWTHLLTALGLAGGFAAQWVSLTSRQAGVEAVVNALQQTVAAIETRAHQSEETGRASDAELRAAVRIIDGKVTQILMQGYRPATSDPRR